jgi:hypothetical protein
MTLVEFRGTGARTPWPRVRSNGDHGAPVTAYPRPQPARSRASEFPERH